jgi:hypothetical protein
MVIEVIRAWFFISAWRKHIQAAADLWEGGNLLLEINQLDKLTPVNDLFLVILSRLLIELQKDIIHSNARAVFYLIFYTLIERIN